MKKTSIIENNKGVTLMESLVVMALVGILALIGIPAYSNFIAKDKARNAASDLIQNARLSRTLAIKENLTYTIAFNPVGNSYSMGVDTTGDGLPDTYENLLVPRVVNLQTLYGTGVFVGSANFTTAPPNDPNGAGIADAVNFQFNPDGSTTANGIAYIQNNNNGRGYTFGVELANTAGMLNLFMWDGWANDAGNAGWTELR